MNNIKLGDVATYINGYAFKPEDRGIKGLPIIRIQDLTGNAYNLGFYNGVYPEKIAIDKGDVLISWSASLGVYVWEKGKALLNQHIFKVLFNKVKINKSYFVFAVQQKLQEIASKTHGATMKHIVKKDFDNIIIPFPSLSEQELIAKKIILIKDIIKRYEVELAILDNLIKARFVEMFGDTEDFSSFSLEESVEEMFIGPFGSSLKNECFVSKEEGFCMVYEQKHAIRKTMDVETRFVDKSKYKELERFTVKGGDIIVSCRGTIGETFIVPPNAPLGIMHPSIMKIRLKKDTYDCTFFDYLLQNALKKHEAEANGSGVKMAITATALGKEKFIIPSMNLQKYFSAFVQQVDKSKFVK